MAFTFDTACRVFQIVLRDGEGPPSKRDGKFFWVFLLEVGNLRRSQNLTVSTFFKAKNNIL